MRFYGKEKSRNASIYDVFDWLMTPILIQCTLWTVRGHFLSA